ncbi:YkvA family protein [Piscinibacter sp. XHJ-5]|uniref:YkvA family protein n=1 Tax=Piscinibacter sp. XHJ-5 TaxID=3037797 RepID=UPI002452E212|nr:YkvA family protein [Piscinibacter sp. XHJ-5]
MSKLVVAGARARMLTYLVALWKLFKHPQTPRLAKWTAIAVVAYAASPIDLIPDFVPVLGMLDDIVIVPLGIALVVRLTPKPLWEACLHEAEQSAQKLPRLWMGAVGIALVWVALLALIAWLVFF